jgi:hypothetical protein
MVFSATASSMPAIAASRPISSSICPAFSPVSQPGPCLGFYLDLPRRELQAITSCQGAINLQSGGKCCNVARANMAKPGDVSDKHRFSFRLSSHAKQETFG